MSATDPSQGSDGDPLAVIQEASKTHAEAPDKGSGELDSIEPRENEQDKSPDRGSAEPSEELKKEEHVEEIKGQEKTFDEGSGEANGEEKDHDEVPSEGSSELDEEGKTDFPVTIEVDHDDSDDSDSDDDAQFLSLPPSPGPVNATVVADDAANAPTIRPEYLVERFRSLNLGSATEPVEQRDGSTTPTQKTGPDSLDLMHSVKGMYRILDLIQEEGSGGLVDKVIISQDSLREFIESLRPGSYSSLTKVDFKGLDKVMIKPVGIYGNREEIVRFLLSIGAINEATADKLCRADDDLSGVSEPELQSGLYAVKPHGPTAPDKHIYVIYWPEATTWNDDAVSSVKRNRVTFLRYLTKLADQVIALISHDYAHSLVWGAKDNSRAIVDVKNRITDRLFTFEVAKTKEQDEDIKIRSGFKMISAALTTFGPLAGTRGDTPSYKPQLLLGEVTQAFLTRQFLPSEEVPRYFNQHEFSYTYIIDLLKAESLMLSQDLEEDAVKTLCLLCLQKRWPEESKNWIQGRAKIDRDSIAEQLREEKELQDTLRRGFPQMTEDLREVIVDEIVAIYPLLHEMLLPAQADRTENIGTERLLKLFSIYPNMHAMYSREFQEAKLHDISEKDYLRLKQRFLILQILLPAYRDLDAQATRELVDKIISARDTRTVEWVLDGYIDSAERSTSVTKSSFGRFGSAASEVWSRFRGSKPSTFRRGHDWVKEAQQQSSSMKDSDFIQNLGNSVSDEAILTNIKDQIKAIAQVYLSRVIDKLVKKISDQAFAIQQEECKRAIQKQVSARRDVAKSRLRSNFIAEINNLSPADPRVSLFVENVEKPVTQRGQYRFTGVCSERRDPTLQCTIYPLKISAEEQHEMQLDPTFIPKLTAEQRNAVKFALPSGYNIAHIQLLENGKVLFIMFDKDKDARIYLEDLMDFPYAVHDRNPKMRLPCEKISEKDIFLFDESKRMLVLCRRDKLELHAFVFDETFRYLQASSSANLSKWYCEYAQPATIHAACFVSGNEEIFILDSTARVRVYSFVTLQCRPASLHLDGIPSNIWSSPDGSCLLALFIKDSLPTLTAYHMNDVVLTSLINRNNVHLIGLDSSSQRCQSVVLDIARNVTEFMFQELGSRKKQQGPHNRNTVHNSLIDCHYDVWTRFPVLPAIERRTITSSSQRRARALVFVADEGRPAFPAYFADMIMRFKNTAKKPTGRELDDLFIHAADFQSLESTLVDETDWQISSLRAGEWLADLICLIPIHIAVCRDNRFIPLKDGVFSTDLERSLLGAESYMASKPVKVVSSMGEQSVGKSFALNHLADTSFAGSAMRTTEGVWLSCTPTDNALIVTLDFEGVHSIERSAQEDTLLVLFNTAISNLVLFRNNFALSRDITGLFQSFQSSATILDPEANPGLFQSTLLIIIKDVVDSDKMEIAREFVL
ncbi:hypothetical protein EWM64_g1473 [Hericium alpestre]|uniref:Guanylate-binding protein N-terminal domain-containing protein n=1 Tax=Hericium alpestre TaxID=135208 RepID=A0A4Z0AAI6_9AGAM|nr:hypothetical protein EWM64_g1473 [Hericium alpestre]